MAVAPDEITDLKSDDFTHAPPDPKETVLHVSHWEQHGPVTTHPTAEAPSRAGRNLLAAMTAAGIAGFVVGSILTR